MQEVVWGRDLRISPESIWQESGRKTPGGEVAQAVGALPCRIWQFPWSMKKSSNYQAKKKEKSQTKDCNPGNRSGKLQELLHWSGVRDAVSYTFETKKLWTISTVSIAQSRFLFFFFQLCMHDKSLALVWDGKEIELQYYSAGLWRSGLSSSHRLISSPCSEEVWFTYNVDTRYTPGKAYHEAASHLSFFFFLSLVVLPQNIFYFPHHLQR